MEPDLNAIVHHMTDIIPSRCGCRGGGWIVTDYDTRHECPLHYRDQPNPEFEYEIDDAVWDAVRLDLDREAYACIRRGSVEDLMRAGLTEEQAFERFLFGVTGRLPANPRPEDWLEAADWVATGIRNVRMDSYQEYLEV